MPHLISKYVSTVIKITLYVNMTESGFLQGERKQDWENRVGPLEQLPGSDLDLFHLMKKNASSPHRPKLYVACGTADFLYPQHQHFIPALKENGWDVTSLEKPDAIHEWGFWDEQIRFFIPWMLEK